MLNRIVLIGRLVRDPELRYTPTNNTPVCTFSLAVDRNRKNAQGERETDFINIVVWGKIGENCATYLSKGKLAAVDGRLQIRSYTDKEGNRRSITEVVAEDVRFLSPKDSSSSGYGGSPYDEPGLSINEDDVPF
jgi:single-strand DNA-binding protein